MRLLFVKRPLVLRENGLNDHGCQHIDRDRRCSTRPLPTLICRGRSTGLSPQDLFLNYSNYALHQWLQIWSVRRRRIDIYSQGVDNMIAEPFAQGASVKDIVFSKMMCRPVLLGNGAIELPTVSLF